MSRVICSLVIIILTFMPAATPTGLAQSKASEDSANANEEPKRKKAGRQKRKPQEKLGKGVARRSDSSTEFDFEETLLEGKMKAPSGMILKGRVQQDKNQMVNLRKNFRPELKKSRAAVRSIRP